MSHPSAAYIQTGKVTTFTSADYNSSSNTPTSAKTVRYSSGPFCGELKDDNTSKSGILKKNRLYQSPSFMSMLASDPEPLKVPIAKPPTYQLGPAKNKHFQTSKIRQIVSKILEEQLSEETYNLERCKHLTTHLTEQILAQLKKVPMDRYKLVCTVLIGQKLGQGIETGSRCAWDDSKDSYTSVPYENKTMYAVVTVYGLYAE